MGNQVFDVVVIGSINMDYVTLTNRLPQKGETVTGHSFRASAGGKGANQAVAAARLGARTAILGCVGDDAIGQTLRASLASNQVNCDSLTTAPAGQSTGVAMVVVDDSGANMIVVAPGSNGMMTPDTIAASQQLIERASVVALQLEIPLEATLFAATTAHLLGKTVVLNPAPAQALPDELLSSIDYLVPNESEASALSGIKVDSIESATEAAKVLIKRGVPNVLITMGELGVLCLTAAGATHHPAKAVQAVDTTAAGDTFIGGLCCSLARGEGLDAAIEFGQAAAAISVTRHGAQASIPYLRELSSSP